MNKVLRTIIKIFAGILLLWVAFNIGYIVFQIGKVVFNSSLIEILKGIGIILIELVIGGLIVAFFAFLYDKMEHLIPSFVPKVLEWIGIFLAFGFFIMVNFAVNIYILKGDKNPNTKEVVIMIGLAILQVIGVVYLFSKKDKDQM